MENIFSSLNGLTETWLTFGSASYHKYLSYILLSGLGLLLLYISSLIVRLLARSLQRKKYAPKLQNNIRHRRGKAFKRKKAGQRDPETAKKLQITLQSKPHNPTGFRQLLWAPVTEAPIALPSGFPANQPGLPALEAPLHTSLSTLSQDQITPPDGVSPSTPLRASLSPQAIAPLKPAVLLTHTPCKMLTSSPLATQEAQLALRAESPREQSSNASTAKSTIYESASSQLWFSAEDQPRTNLPHVKPYASRGSYRRLTKVHAAEPEDHLSPGPDVLALFKRQEKRDADVAAYKLKKEKTVSFLIPESTSGEISASSADVENADLYHLLGKKKGEPGGPHPQQEPSHLKNSEDQSEIKDNQLFWGLPSLHSESLKHEAANSVNSYPERDDFHRIAEASTGRESSNLTYPIPLLLPESDQQGQTVPQSQIKPDSPTDSKAQTQSRLPFLPSSPQSQLRICGVRFHSLKDEGQPLAPYELQQLEYNLLQKTLQGFLGLPTLTQRFQEGFGPSPPKISSTRHSSKAHAPKKILPGDFPFNYKLERKLEHHLRKRLIQRRWGLPQRIRESLSFMNPHSKIPEVPEARNSHGLSWISHYKFNTNSLSGLGLSQTSSFHKKPLESHSLKAKDVKVQGQCPGIGQRDHIQGDSSGALMSRVHSNSETDPELQLRDMSGKISKASLVKQCQRECESFLQEQLGRNTKEISRGEMSSAADRSGHSTNMAQTPPGTSPRQVAPLLSEEDARKEHEHSLTLSDNQEKVLEEHITDFGRRMAFGLPQRVEESLESYLTRAEPSQPFPQLHTRAHSVCTVDSDKPSRFLRRNTNGDRKGTVDLVPVQHRPLPAAWLAGHTQPASENKKVCVDKDLSMAPSGREPIKHWTPSMAHKGIRQHSRSDSRPDPEPPMSPDGPTEERLASSNNTQGSQGERKNWKDCSMAEGSTDLHKGEQLPGPDPQSTKNLKGTQDLCSPGSHATECQSLQGMSVPQDSETPHSKSQVSTEVVPNSEGETHIQVPDLPATAFASEEMTSKPRGPSSGDMAVSQVLHVHFPSVGINMEPRQGPWVPAYVSGKSKNKDCPPAARGVPPLVTEAGKLGGGDAGLGTSQTRGKRHCAQARAAEETQGHTSSPALTPKSQPLENQFPNQVKGFWQRLSPGRKHKGQEKILARGCSSLMPVKGASLIKGRCEFCGNTAAQKCVREPGMVLRKQLGFRHWTVIPCPQAPVSPLMGSVEAQQELQLQAQAEPAQRLPHFCCRASCSQVQRAESCSPGQGQTALERCGTTGKAKMVEPSPMHASPPKSYL
ncbi:SPATA31 subfamily D, member 3 isoform X2 [Rattus norvegicus]|uniref:SPATA31 subfamily D, member 3 n=1 Tax=Rattus norvegicus TaxID=10116 RepID=A0A8I5Y6X7_RAT|nr:SPATA31 subfamily D, member 3 isoform X2 [Rattus norvegicus]